MLTAVDLLFEHPRPMRFQIFHELWAMTGRTESTVLFFKFALPAHFKLGIKMESIIWIERGICTEDKEMQWPPPSIKKKQSCGSVAWHSSPELRIADTYAAPTRKKRVPIDALGWFGDLERDRQWWFLHSIACPLLHTFLLPLLALHWKLSKMVLLDRSPNCDENVDLSQQNQLSFL